MDEPLDRWRTEASEQLADCRVFKVRRDDKVRISADPARAGQQHAFFVIESPNWINVVALTDDHQIVLIEQFRHGTDTVELEVPGGLVDPGEQPLEAAIRELREETGFVARHWVHIGTTAANPAIQNNHLDTYIALGAQHVSQPDFDSTEHIRWRYEPFESALKLVDSGVIRHSLVIVALYRAKRYLESV